MERSAPVGNQFSATAGCEETVRIDGIADRQEWERLFNAAAFSHLPQSYAYGEAKSAKGWSVRRVRFSLGDRVIAIASLLELRVLGLSLVTRINRGPIFIDADPAVEQVRAVYQAIRRRWGRIHNGILLLAPALESIDQNRLLLGDLGFRLRQHVGWGSGRVDLKLGEDQIWASLAPSFRNKIRKAEKAGATLHIGTDNETFDWLIERHLDNMRQKNFNGLDATFLRALRAAAPENVVVFRLLHEGSPVAGISLVRFGSSCEYHIGWFGEEGRKVNAGNALLWYAIREMKRLGCTDFDVGGLSGGGYSQFKRAVNPVEYALAGEWMSL